VVAGVDGVGKFAGACVVAVDEDGAAIHPVRVPDVSYSGVAPDGTTGGVVACAPYCIPKNGGWAVDAS
jgi:hypothetical protein